MWISSQIQGLGLSATQKLAMWTFIDVLLLFHLANLKPLVIAIFLLINNNYVNLLLLNFRKKLPANGLTATRNRMAVITEQAVT